MADGTEIGALIVAAMAVASGPITARLTYDWTRKADADRWQRERAAEAERWQREDNARRVERGEAAAGEILTIVDKARLRLAGFERVGQMDFQPSYHEIRRLANLITDDEVQRRIFEVADAVFYYHQAQAVEKTLGDSNIAHTYAEAAHLVLRAYLQGRPCPATPRLARLTALIAEGGAYIDARLDDDGPDPLGPADESTA